MTSKAIKIAVTCVVLAGALAGLMYTTLATFVVASYAVAACVAGGRRRSRALVESGVGAFYLTAALMSIASAIIVRAFLIGDYTIKYVQHYSDSAQPLGYRITSYWGGL